MNVKFGLLMFIKSLKYDAMALLNTHVPHLIMKQDYSQSSSVVCSDFSSLSSSDDTKMVKMKKKKRKTINVKKKL